MIKHIVLKSFEKSNMNLYCLRKNHRTSTMHLFAVLAVFLSIILPAQAGLVLGKKIVSESEQAGAFPLVTSAGTATLYYNEGDYKGVIRAIGDLQMDIERVTGKKAELSADRPTSGRPVIIGTVGQSGVIDSLAASGKLDVSELKGQWESFIITTIDKPIAGVEQALVIAGSDKRGTIYGIYEISEQIGVSPWYWWADVPAAQHAQLYVLPGRYVSGEPGVKYRGIFINDEEPCFGPWAREKFGGINSKMYTHMFELILRLRGNYLWPAMWGKAFNEDDPENPRLADEYGIVMGTSHHEPMIRAQAEWGAHRRDFGNGQWNYATNEEGLKKFWEEGIKRNKDYESIVTIGMRGDGDEPMIRGGDMQANVDLLEKIVADQRQILTDFMNPDITKIPQLWALYKEVANYYAFGMRVPDDVTLLWCDDNWGNIRRLPTDEERKRSGGAGIYYHFDYVGGPRSYKWINTNPLPKIWEQMNMAYEYDATKIWVVNVGDLKPMELPIDFFLTLAWNPRALPKEKIGEYTKQWAQREFGPGYAGEIAEIVSRYAKYNGRRKPELIDGNTFSLVNYREADRVAADWQEIIDKAEEINEKLPAKYRDAFYQLVLHPAKASGTVVQMYIAAGRNQLYAAQGRASANAQAERVRELFQLDQQLSDKYHTINDGKWNHMMAQTHIGYRSWSDPRNNVMPRTTEVTPEDSESMGVAVEGSENAWPGGSGTAELPAFDSLNQQTRWIDVFKRGSKSFSFSAKADKPWIRLSETAGTVDADKRIEVSIDWAKVPVGQQSAVITLSGPAGQSVAVRASAVRSDTYTRETIDAFGGLTGPVAFPAASAAKNIAAGGVRWEEIPDYGWRTSAMVAFPMTAKSVTPPENSARLEYPVFIAKPGQVEVLMITGPTLKVQPDRGVRIGISFDDQPPKIIDAFQGQATGGDGANAPAFRDWDKWVKDNARILSSTHEISEAGVHTLKVWMVDPGTVLETLVVTSETLPASYMGPPESGLN